jgi:hypothetical protein
MKRAEENAKRPLSPPVFDGNGTRNLIHYAGNQKRSQKTPAIALRRTPQRRLFQLSRRGASWANEWPDSYDALPRLNLPRSIFLNRASFPLFWISRRIAE